MNLKVFSIPIKIAILLVYIVWVLTFAVSCTSVSSDGRLKKETLEEAVKKYWQYKKENKMELAYLYENIYYKKIATKEKYLSGFGGDTLYINDFEIVKIGEEGSGTLGFTPATVKYSYSYPTAPFPVPKTMQMQLVDLWVKQKDGRWYHIRQLAGGYY
ncbi:MAG: hypothetical protein L3V56_06150 [Candidatus Magnetoovum sp. WYHC-5]|nr:hypothetical protein [Candidatus Magnetoovum sp. WYHC-5]